MAHQHHDSLNPVLSLPVPLILLVHLHILHYPHANEPEYDHNIFNTQVRGLRDRIKTLEDVCYFLVGRLEGNAKTVLPSYPCVQPSDTVAFRTSLAKYLENLRHQSLYPSSKVSTTKTEGKNTSTGNVAWWWKDVVVRKSLLEECAGERFERLLLSLSTHALLKGIRSSMAVSPDSAYDLLHTQPRIYTSLLSKHKSTRHTWAHSASLLLQRQDSLKSLREHLAAHGGRLTSRYSHLATERLVALVDAKRQDLLDQAWNGHEGRLALEFLADISGLQTSDHATHADATSRPVEPKHPMVAPQPQPQPLPIAAAHHPGSLKKLRRSVFSQQNQNQNLHGKQRARDSAAPLPSLAAIALAGRLDAELRMRQTMVGALADVKRAGEDLAMQVKGLPRDRVIGTTKRSLAIDLWQLDDGTASQVINFDTEPTPELLSSLSLYRPDEEIPLEARIDNIQQSVLPPYPPVPDLLAPRVPVVEALPASDTRVQPGLSRIPRANPESKQPPPEPPSRRPLTSTPPADANYNLATKQGITKNATRVSSKTPRKSIRFSLAVNPRPPLFAASGDPNGRYTSELEDEVYRIVHGTEDESLEDALAPVTPRAKGAPVNRIFTGTRGSTAKRPKQSYPMAFHEPAVALPPLLVSSSSSFDELVNGSDDEEWGSGEGAQLRGRTDDDDTGSEELYRDEAPSMTLRDILLRADTTQFDLLDEDDGDSLGEESFGWD